MVKRGWVVSKRGEGEDKESMVWLVEAASMTSQTAPQCVVWVWAKSSEDRKRAVTSDVEQVSFSFRERPSQSCESTKSTDSACGRRTLPVVIRPLPQTIPATTDVRFGHKQTAAENVPRSFRLLTGGPTPGAYPPPRSDSRYRIHRVRILIEVGIRAPLQAGKDRHIGRCAV